MAAEHPPNYAETGNQSSADNFPPAYNEATGTLDVHQDGIRTASEVASRSRL